MSRSIPLGALVALCLVLSGCKDTHESLRKEAISKMEKAVGVLKGVTDESSARSAATKLNDVWKELDDVITRGKNLEKEQKLSPEEQRRLEEKFKPQLEEVGKQFRDELARIGRDPKTAAALGDALVKFRGIR